MRVPLSSAAASWVASGPISVPEFAAKAFVQRSIESPWSPTAVLSFFYGEDFWAPEHKEYMTEGRPLATMQMIWYGSNNKEYDDLCKHFSPVIRGIVGGQQQAQPEASNEWNGSIDGLMSQLLLCDQLSRNCFRGTEEAFKYDAVGVVLATRLARAVFSSPEDDNSQCNKEEGSFAKLVPGEFYGTYSSNVITALSHAEDVSSLQLALNVLESSFERYQDRELVVNSLTFQKDHLAQHRAVIDRFGRYPHRNAKLGRSNTPEEQAWLDDVDNLPGWAKSQG